MQCYFEDYVTQITLKSLRSGSVKDYTTLEITFFTADLNALFAWLSIKLVT
jgi:hypothetical protein